MRPRRRHRLSTLLLLLTVLGGVRAVAGEPSRVVLLEAVGNPVDVDALRTSLEEWLRSMQLDLHLVGVLPPPAAESSFARVRVVWTDEVCVVEVFGQDGVVRRRKSLPRGGPPLLISESAALIAQAGVQELSVEASRRRPLPAPISLETPMIVEPPAVPLPPFGLSLAAYFQGRGYDARAPFVPGGGAEVAATFGDGPWHPKLSLLLAYQGPIGRDGVLVRMHMQLQTLSLRLVPSVSRRFGPFEVDLGIGGGLDALIATTTSSEVPAEALTPESLHAAPLFTAALGVRFRLTASSAVFLRAVVDLDPARRRFVSRVADQREYLLVPWIARPAVQLGFSFDLLSRVVPSP